MSKLLSSWINLQIQNYLYLLLFLKTAMAIKDEILPCDCFRIGKITIIVCRLRGDRYRVLHEQIDEELLKFVEVFIIHYDMTSQQGSQPKLLCPEYNSTVPSICIKYWFHIANQSSWINPKYIQNCTKSSWCEAWRHAASLMKSLSEILNLLIFISLWPALAHWLGVGQCSHVRPICVIRVQ